MKNSRVDRASETKAISRRDFCTLAGRISLLVGSGNLPLLAAGAPRPEPANLPYAVKDYPEVMAAFAPSARSAPGETRTYAYRRYNWPAAGRRAAPAESWLVIKRVPSGSGVDYIMEQKLAATRSSLMSITAHCQDPRRGIASWKLTNAIDNACGFPSPQLTLNESGTVAERTVAFDRGPYTETVTHENPLFALWQLADVVPALAPKNTKTTIDLLDDGILLRPGVTLAYDGAIEAPVARRQTLRLDSYVVYGPGILPAHYLYDEQGMPQLITCFMRMYALASVS